MKISVIDFSLAHVDGFLTCEFVAHVESPNYENTMLCEDQAIVKDANGLSIASKKYTAIISINNMKLPASIVYQTSQDYEQGKRMKLPVKTVCYDKAQLIARH